MKNGRDLMISRKKIGSGKWVTVKLPHKNTLIGPKKEWGDSHNTISVGVSKTDGTIHIFYDHHNDPLKYIVSKKNTAFVKDSEFKIGIFNKTRGYLAAGEPIRITYPKVTENNQGDLIVNYRKGSAVGGNEMIHVYNGKKSTWSKAKMVMRGAGKPDVEVKDRNYAYAPPPVLAGGNLYYGFSVRWARKKDDGVLNEDLYVANTGSKMDTWKTIDFKNPKNLKLPVQDYSPLLVAKPKSKGGKGSSGGPSLAVSDRGDVHISYRSRGNDSKFDYTYVRKAGTKDFKEYAGIAKTGIAYGNRIYNVAINKGNGQITIQSTEAGAFYYKNDLVYKSGDVLGSSSVQIVNGKLVVISEDRSNTKTDSQGIFCYVFQIGKGTVVTPPQPTEPNTADITTSWYKFKNVSSGKFLHAAQTGNTIKTVASQSGFDKQWRIVKAGNGSLFNIDNRKTNNNSGSGVLAEGNKNTIAGTNMEPVKLQEDKQWSVVSLGGNIYQFKLKKNGRYLAQNKNDKGVLQVADTSDQTKWELIQTDAIDKTNTLGGINISEDKNTTVVDVYPNPTSDRFTITLRGINKAQVTISDMLGKRVFSKNVANKNVEVVRDSKFTPGMYIVTITGDSGQVYFSKLIIK